MDGGKGKWLKETIPKNPLLKNLPDKLGASEKWPIAKLSNTADNHGAHGQLTYAGGSPGGDQL